MSGDVRATGKAGEERAKNYLIKNGYEIIGSNYHSRYGEIDIIARRKNIIAFVEVKTRKINSVVKPIEAVTREKIKRLLMTAQVYIEKNEVKLQPRFDVCEVTLYEDGSVRVTNYIKNAFIQEDDHAIF